MPQGTYLAVRQDEKVLEAAKAFLRQTDGWLLVANLVLGLACGAIVSAMTLRRVGKINLTLREILEIIAKTPAPMPEEQHQTLLGAIEPSLRTHGGKKIDHLSARQSRIKFHPSFAAGCPNFFHSFSTNVPRDGCHDRYGARWFGSGTRKNLPVFCPV